MSIVIIIIIVMLLLLLQLMFVMLFAGLIRYFSNIAVVWKIQMIQLEIIAWRIQDEYI